MKPLIGITVNYVSNEQIGEKAHICGTGQFVQALADDYVKAVELAGGIPVMIPVLSDRENAKNYLEILDGIIFSGGCDISPLTFGTDTTKEVGEVCPVRDAQELYMIKAALAKPNFPVLGICRGSQLLNVALGGSLVLDIDTKKYGEHCLTQQAMSVPTHTIKVQEGTMIYRLLQGDTGVNSYHHQCVDRPGEKVVVTSKDSHGITESIEVPRRAGFTMGVQWHPESLSLGSEGQLNIFKELIKSADKNRKG